MDTREERIINELEAERDWRIKELKNIKLLFRDIDFNLQNDEYNNIYLKMTLPMIYAHWEGYVVESYRLIFEFINRINLSSDEVTYKILTYANNNSYNSLKGKHSFEQKCKFTENFLSVMKSNIKISGKIDTKSNLKFEVFIALLNIFNIDVSNFNEFKFELDKLVNIRNSIAHGENSYILSYNDIERYIEFVTKLMDRLLIEEAKFIEAKGFKIVAN